MEPLECREALPEDEDALVEIWWDMQAGHLIYDQRWYANKGEEVCKASWGAHFRSLLRDEECIIIVAVSERAPVGFLLARINLRPPIYEVSRVLTIDSTAVQPDFRGQGVFGGMLTFLEARARENDIGVIELRVQDGNQARQAYESTGFVPEALSMIKWIDES